MKERVGALLKAVEGARSALILPHNDPDPDAIASAVALRYLLAQELGVEVMIAYRGIVGRAENRALVRYLRRPLKRLSAADLRRSIPIALVDTQPGAGNNPLPAEITPAIVLDHHPRHERSDSATFADIRSDLGSTSTILTEYLQAAGVELEPWLATALFYGIKTDTMGLIRGANPADVAAYFFLQPQIDVEALMEIERAQVPPEYYRRLHAALQGAQVFDSVVVSYMGPMSRPDMTAEMADLLLRLRGIQWAICIGAYRGELILAVRNRSRRGGAGQLAREIVGDWGRAGGHGAMAGGQIPLRKDPAEQVAQRLVQRALDYLGVAPDVTGRPLV